VPHVSRWVLVPPRLLHPIDCPSGAFCPSGSTKPLPCPVDHQCPSANMPVPLPCALCTLAAGGRGSNIGCSATSVGGCASLAVAAPVCGLTECTDLMAGQRGTVVRISADAPLCNGLNVSCGSLEAHLMVALGGREEDRQVALLGALGPGGLANRREFTIVYRMPATRRQASATSCASPTPGPAPRRSTSGAGPAATCWWCATTAASWPGGSTARDDALLDSLCDDLHDEGSRPVGSHAESLAVYGSMACRCISLRAIGLDCEQVQAANSLVAQRPSTYVTAAQAALAALAQVQSKRRDDAILRAVQAVAASGAAAAADRFAQLQRSLDALDKARVQPLYSFAVTVLYILITNPPD
jgi:hypothetical protein